MEGGKRGKDEPRKTMRAKRVNNKKKMRGHKKGRHTQRT